MLLVCGFDGAAAGMRFGGNPLEQAREAPERWEPLVRVPEIPTVLRTVNFFSGIPLMGQGVDHSGGFGDVAANLVEARNFAKANPGITVNVIITSKWQLESRNSEAPSERIAEIMVPGLDSKVRNVVQKVEGIHYLFFSQPLGFVDWETIDKIIPKADLSINLSGGIHMRRVMERTAPVAFTVQEPSDSNDILDFNAFTHFKGISRRLFFILHSGVRSTGLYLQHPKPKLIEQGEARVQVLSALRDAQVAINEFAPNSEIAFAYTKFIGSTVQYAQGVSAFARLPANQQKVFYLFVKKDFVSEVIQDLPKNVVLFGLTGLPESTVRLLIQGSSLSPMVTGDVSFSIALDSITPQKGLMLEAPYTMKWNSALALIEQVARRAVELGLSPTLEAAQARFKKALVLVQGYGYRGGADVLASLENQDVWQDFYRCLSKPAEGWRMLKNLALYYRLFGLFQHEFTSAVLVPAKRCNFGYQTEKNFLEFLLRELQQSADWDAFPERLRMTIRDEGVPFDRRVFCLIALLKMPAVSPQDLMDIGEGVWREALGRLNFVAPLVRSSLDEEHFHSKLAEMGKSLGIANEFRKALTEYFSQRLPKEELRYLKSACPTAVAEQF